LPGEQDGSRPEDAPAQRVGGWTVGQDKEEVMKFVWKLIVFVFKIFTFPLRVVAWIAKPGNGCSDWRKD